MGVYEKGSVRIRYEEHGSGFPLLMIAGGGLNSSIKSLVGMSPFQPIEEFKNEYRCIAFDLRNANGGNPQVRSRPTGHGICTPMTSLV